jgi:hypothetical protein
MNLLNKIRLRLSYRSPRFVSRVEESRFFGFGTAGTIPMLTHIPYTIITKR